MCEVRSRKNSQEQKQKKKHSGQQQKEIDCDEPHPVPNEKTQPIQWTERPTGALVAVDSLCPCVLIVPMLCSSINKISSNSQCRKCYATHHVSPSRQLFNNAQSILHQEIGFSIVNQLQIVETSSYGLKWRPKKGTKLLFSSKLVLKRISLPVLDLPYLCLHCCSTLSLESNLVRIKSFESCGVMPRLIKWYPVSVQLGWI